MASLHGSFTDAAASNNVPELQRILHLDPTQINQKTTNFQGSTALHIASYRGAIAAMKFLIKNGADINATDKRNHHPLHIAAFGNQLEATQILLKAGASNTHCNIFKCTALHIAAEKGFVQVIQCLVTQGLFDTEARNQAGLTVLSVACKHSHLNAVKLLVNTLNAKVNDKRVSPFNIVAKMWTSVEMDYNQDQSQDNSKDPAIDVFVKILRVLGKRGAKVDQRYQGGETSSATDALFSYAGWTPLTLATLFQCTRLIMFLMVEMAVDVHVVTGNVKENKRSGITAKVAGAMAGVTCKQLTALLPQLKANKVFHKLTGCCQGRIQCTHALRNVTTNRILCCPGCHNVNYCSVEHMNSDKEKHAPRCLRLQKMKERRPPKKWAKYNNVARRSTMGAVLQKNILNNAKALYGKEKFLKSSEKKQHKKIQEVVNTLTLEQHFGYQWDHVCFLFDATLLDPTFLLGPIKVERAHDDKKNAHLNEDWHTSDVRLHTCPPDPVFAVEILGEKRLGQSVDFLEYGGYCNANILNLEIPTTAFVGNIKSQRPDNFCGASLEYATQAVVTTVGEGTEGTEGTDVQWIGCSSKYRCEIFARMDDKVEYVTKLDNSLRNQYNTITAHRASWFLLYGDPDAAPTSEQSKTRLVMYKKKVVGKKGEGGGGIFVLDVTIQPDGSVCDQDSYVMNDGNHYGRYFRAFLCAADCHDTASFPSLFRVAQTAAFATGRLVEFADAVDRFVTFAVQQYYEASALPPGGFDRHPFPETAFGYYLHQAGEAHEAAASLVSKISQEDEKKQLRRAVCSYKMGAYLTTQSKAEDSVDWRLRQNLWDCLGLAIRRYASLIISESTDVHNVYFDMAERSYRWSLAVLSPFRNNKNNSEMKFKWRSDKERKKARKKQNKKKASGKGVTDKDEAGAAMQHTVTNLQICVAHRHKSKQENLETSRDGMKDQRRGHTKTAVAAHQFTAEEGSETPADVLASLASQASSGDLPTPAPTTVCSSCSASSTPEGKKLWRCGGCHMVYYCSKQCAKKEWPKHKKICRSKNKETEK